MSCSLRRQVRGASRSYSFPPRPPSRMPGQGPNGVPPSASRRTSSLPMVPVAPVTAIMDRRR